MSKNYSYLIKPASSSCNLQCTYCFYHDVSAHRMNRSLGLMQEKTMKGLIDKACSVEDHSNITFAFQGGEPTLIGLPFFQSFISEVSLKKKANQKIKYSIQTNGTLIDSEWCVFLKDNEFLVGISLDGFEENHDTFRITQKTPTFERVMKTIQLLRENAIDFNILTVLTSSLAQEPEQLFRFYLENKFEYIQLIPCLPGLDFQEDPYALTPDLFSSFYKVFYDLWLSEFKNGHYMSVTLFDDLIPMFRGIAPSQCGMLGYCSPQFVIEADGGVYPCDFYVLDQYQCGNIVTDSLDQILGNQIMHGFLKEPKRMSPLCETCKFKMICQGNCKRLNIAYFNDTYCGYQDFLEHAHPSMMEIANRLK